MGGPLQPSQVSLKTVFTICFGVVCVAVAVGFVLETSVAIGFLAAALLLAIALDHLVGAMQRRGASRGFAIAVVVICWVLLMVGIVLLLIPPIANQVRQLYQSWPNLMSKLRHSEVYQEVERRFHVSREVSRAESNATGLVKGAVSPVLFAISTVVDIVVAVVSVFFLTLLMLIFGRQLVTRFFREVLPSRRPRYRRVARNIHRAIGGYIGGILLICSINATAATIFLTATREPYALALGVLSGTSSLVPYVGPVIAGTVITGFAWATGGVWKALATAIYFVIYGQIEGNVLAPLIFRRTVHVNPLITLAAILLLGDWAGIFGAIIAVPVASVAQIILYEILVFRREHLREARRPPPPK